MSRAGASRAGKRGPGGAKGRTAHAAGGGGGPGSSGDLRGSTRDPPVVGIGASAGGIAAIGRFLERMPGDSGLAFVVVIHLDPTRESHAAQVLAPHTGMPVLQAEDSVRVEANRVYVIVPDRSLTISQGRLHLSDFPGPRGNRRPVDTFLQTLADDLRERAIGIILSGTGSNGTVGMRTVKAQGGMTMVQDPETADFGGMPRSAIAAGAADYVLAPEAMPEVLLRYVQHPYLTIGERAAALETQEGRRIDDILSLLHVRSGQDFRPYRRPTLVRRIHRRMGLKHVYRLNDYVKVLREEPTECDALLRDLLINVTGFFRDPEAWEALRKEVIEPMVARQRAGGAIRCWVPGCASGEEAYSLAILLLEECDRAEKRVDIKIFATDAVTDALSVGRMGLYPGSVVADVSAERLRRFFEQGEDVYQVREEVRKLLVFAPQNLLQDPPFSKLDLVSCRNVLIYLEADIQKRLLALLHFALREGGHLFLGSSESVGGDVHVFERVSRKARIFRRIGGARHGVVDFPLVSAGGAPRPLGDGLIVRPPRRGPRLLDAARQVLLERYAPAAALIDHRYHVLHFLGRTDRYLFQPPGEPTTDLLAMAREGLRTRLRAAIQQAQRERQPVTVPGAHVKRGQRFTPVTIEVALLEHATEDGAYYLVSFREEAAPAAAAQPEPGVEQALQRDLEHELSVTRDDLQSSIEEVESANEELKASNEEVLSMNEELQSANEELETSREELQSLNEELSTVNSQLQAKVDELEAATNDLANLLANTDIGTIFLDTQFQIRNFTPPVTRLLDVLPSDVGRPLHHFAPKFTGADLTADARQVLDSLMPLENEVESEEGRVYLHRTLPYRTRDHRIGGVVITFVDITDRKAAERKLAEMNQLLEGQLDERTALLRLLKDIGSAANEARTVEGALTAAVRLFAEHQGWAVGHAYLVSDDGAECAPVAGAWYGREGLATETFRTATMERRLAAGVGFAGAVLATAIPVWAPSVRGDPRGTGDDGGLALQAAVFFPVVVHGAVRAVLAFYSARGIERNAALESTIASVAFQLAQVVERDRVAHRVAQMAEDEQRRTGRELHDRLGQSLSALGMLARGLQRNVETRSPEDLNRLVRGIEDAKLELRLLAKGLIPSDLDAGGLPLALEDAAARWSELYGVPCRFEGGRDAQLPAGAAAVQLFRIAQEALRNAAQHAHATHVEVDLRGTGDALVLEVRDNGAGFDREAARSQGMGLRIMEHRAGLIGATLSIDGNAGGGTVVRCVLPDAR